MPKTPLSPVRRAFAAQAVQRPRRALEGLVEGVRRADEVEAVHKMRVASRRLRNALELFFDELPAEERPGWLRRIRRVTRALGAARDLDVQIEFLRSFLAAETSAAARAGVELLRADFVTRRRKLQKDVLRAMDRLDADDMLGALSCWARRWSGARLRARWTDANLRAEAGRAGQARLAAVLAYEASVERPECVTELHAMRIAAKHLRYTLEVYEPLFARGLKTHIAWARGLQDALGAVHDCDVWLTELPQLRERQHRRAGPLPAKRRRYQQFARGVDALLADRQAHREQLYAHFIAAWHREAAGAVQRLRRTLGKAPPPAARAADGDQKPARARGAARWRAAVPFDPANQPCWAAALALAREYEYEAGHAHQVTGLALRLFDELAGLTALDARRREWLANAGLLHDIGWVQGRAGHHKTSLRLIRDAQRLPWSRRERQIVAAVARYHRGALPRYDQACFGSLSAADRETVQKLAALLRLADGLDYTHQGLIRDVHCRVTPEQIEIDCVARAPAAEEIGRARRKSDLLRQAFNREIVVRWRLSETSPSDRS
jgi:CHAD domain-containing protein